MRHEPVTSPRCPLAHARVQPDAPARVILAAPAHGYARSLGRRSLAPGLHAHETHSGHTVLPCPLSRAHLPRVTRQPIVYGLPRVCQLLAHRLPLCPCLTLASAGLALTCCQACRWHGGGESVRSGAGAQPCEEGRAHVGETYHKSAGPQLVSERGGPPLLPSR